jgi:class 3 adenylate cyclase
MRCPECGHENAAEMKFCGECGNRLTVLCRECGARNAPAQKFCGECGARLGSEASSGHFLSPDAYTPQHLAEKILTSKAVLEGKRKQVTVLFADLKGSMELLADRDPEEARKLLDPVIERMMGAVHRYEGTVNQVMGDGIMALFGAPLAHEDHAVRACYAALRMQEVVRRYSDELRRALGNEARIRIGINSGEVVVRSIGSDLRMDYTAVGQTTHLAARMEQLAAPGSVRITPGTLRLAEGFVEVASLGHVPVKGLAEPVEVFELLGPTPPAPASKPRREEVSRASSAVALKWSRSKMLSTGQAWVAGRSSPSTIYRKLTKRRFDIAWTIEHDAIAYDHKSDGMYPLITNDRSMSPVASPSLARTLGLEKKIVLPILRAPAF